MIRLFALALALTIASAAPSRALAGQKPPQARSEQMIRNVVYAPRAIVQIDGRFGFLTMVEFAADEKIVNVAIGDASAWQVSAPDIGNALFLKPLSQGAFTNLAVITNRRTYTFTLSARASRPSAAAFRVIFSYPDDEAQREAEAAALARKSSERAARLAAIDAPEKRVYAVWNAAYPIVGDRAVRPKQILDDGHFTFFELRDHAEPPTIFAIDEDGGESQVNFTVRGPYLVVEQLAPAWRIRAGAQSAKATNIRYTATSGVTRQAAARPVSLRPNAP